jgi:hypothetical protein
VYETFHLQFTILVELKRVTMTQIAELPVLKTWILVYSQATIVHKNEALKPLSYNDVSWLVDVNRDSPDSHNVKNENDNRRPIRQFVVNIN